MEKKKSGFSVLWAINIDQPKSLSVTMIRHTIILTHQKPYTFSVFIIPYFSLGIICFVYFSLLHYGMNYTIMYPSY